MTETKYPKRCESMVGLTDADIDADIDQTECKHPDMKELGFVVDRVPTVESGWVHWTKADKSDG